MNITFPMPGVIVGVTLPDETPMFAKYGEQCADTDGLAMATLEERCAEAAYRTSLADVALLATRVAGLETKLEATMMDMRSIAKERDNYRGEAQRLSVLVTQLRTELAQRMALPPNALKHLWGSR